MVSGSPARRPFLAGDPSRAKDKLIEVRADLSPCIDPARSMLRRSVKGEWRRWTWAGIKVNRTLMAWFLELMDQNQKVTELSLRLHRDLPLADIQAGLARIRAEHENRPLPPVPTDALRGLKFSVALPRELAVETLAHPTADVNGALATLLMSMQVVIEGQSL